MTFEAELNVVDKDPVSDIGDIADMAVMNASLRLRMWNAGPRIDYYNFFTGTGINYAAPASPIHAEMRHWFGPLISQTPEPSCSETRLGMFELYINGELVWSDNTQIVIDQAFFESWLCGSEPIIKVQPHNGPDPPATNSCYVGNPISSISTMPTGLTYPTPYSTDATAPPEGFDWHFDTTNPATIAPIIGAVVYTYTIETGALPAGVTIDQVTGVISGVSTEVFTTGSVSITATGTNAYTSPVYDWDSTP